MGHDQKYVDKKYEVVGERFNRPDGIDKVTGKARYGADASAPGQLVGRVLRSPHAHAQILKINTAKAEKLPGVKSVVTFEDMPDLTGGDQGLADILENCMARGRALYDGHAVAAVAAVDEQTAAQALKLIDVKYKKLPHVTDVDEAMLESAPVIHDRIITRGVEPAPTKPSNISARTQMGYGDVDAGFAEADVIIEKTYKTEQTHQGYIEPHACLASVNPDGSAELWVTTQGHFVFRNVCASLLGLDIAKLKVTSSEIGGGFGGKTHVWGEPVALALSRKANRPVKLVMGRDEVFRGTGPCRERLRRDPSPTSPVGLPCGTAPVPPARPTHGFCHRNHHRSQKTSPSVWQCPNPTTTRIHCGKQSAPEWLPTARHCHRDSPTPNRHEARYSPDGFARFCRFSQ